VWFKCVLLFLFGYVVRSVTALRSSTVSFIGPLPHRRNCRSLTIGTSGETLSPQTHSGQCPSLPQDLIVVYRQTVSV
jgi:hypothetical protein